MKGKLFIRLLNADKNRDVLKDTIHHKVGDIALVLYYMAGEKDGYILSTKVKKHFLEQYQGIVSAQKNVLMEQQQSFFQV